jgi:hypothetical protein
VVEILSREEDAAASLGVEKSHDVLRLERFLRQRAARALARGVFDFPAFGDQPEESAPQPKRRFHGEMGQIVEREVERMTGLLLPCDGAIGSRATQHSCAIGALGDLDDQHNIQTLQQLR